MGGCAKITQGSWAVTGKFMLVVDPASNAFHVACNWMHLAYQCGSTKQQHRTALQSWQSMHCSMQYSIHYSQRMQYSQRKTRKEKTRLLSVIEGKLMVHLSFPLA